MASAQWCSLPGLVHALNRNSDNWRSQRATRPCARWRRRRRRHRRRRRRRRRRRCRHRAGWARDGAYRPGPICCHRRHTARRRSGRQVGGGLSRCPPRPPQPTVLGAAAAAPVKFSPPRPSARDAPAACRLAAVARRGRPAPTALEAATAGASGQVLAGRGSGGHRCPPPAVPSHPIPNG